MGIAIISGMLASLEARPANGTAVPTPSKSGTSTPLPSYMLYAPDAALPSRFIACVRRPESSKKLRRLFTTDFADKAENIEIVNGENVAAAKKCDVVLLW
jgi:pyrroline-5-carboxylate reductase